MNTAIDLDRAAGAGQISQRDRANELPIRVLLTACDIGAGAALIGWLWPTGVMEVPLAAVSIAMLLRASAAILLAVLTLGMLVPVWSGDGAERVNYRK